MDPIRVCKHSHVFKKIYFIFFWIFTFKYHICTMYLQRMYNLYIYIGMYHVLTAFMYHICTAHVPRLYQVHIHLYSIFLITNTFSCTTNVQRMYCMCIVYVPHTYTSILQYTQTYTRNSWL